MNNDAVAKIVMLQSSWRCFVYGLVSLVPGVGVPFAVLALWNAGKARIREKTHWNVARPYRILGTICAAVGGIIWGGLLSVIIVTALWNLFTGG